MSELCQTIDQRLEELVGRPADPADQTLAQLRVHAEECARCRALLHETERALEVYRRSSGASPSSQAVERLRREARAALAREQRARSVQTWSRHLALAASLVIVAGLGVYLLRERPAEVRPVASSRQERSAPARTLAPTPAPIESPSAPATAAPTPPPAPAGAPRRSVAEPAADLEGSLRPQPFPASSSLEAERTAQMEEELASGAAPQQRAPSVFDAPASEPPLDRVAKSEARVASESESTEALPPAGATAALLEPEEGLRARQLAQRSAFASRTASEGFLPCIELEARANRLSQGDSAERGSALLAAADCWRAEQPLRAADLYLKAASADPTLRAALEQRLLELEQSTRLPDALRARIAAWLASRP